MIGNRTPPAERPVTIFSRLFDTGKVEDAPVTVDIEASEAERAAIAKQDGVPAVSALSARLVITPAGRGRFNVTGEVRGKVTQVCVVSLEPFDTEIVEPVDVSFAPPEDVERAEAAYAKRRDEDPTGLDMDEPPDPIVNGKIDLGLVASEFLALALDPYPRKPGVEFTHEAGQDAGDEEVSPFAALAKLRKPEAGE